jgi:hypothetical protein
MHASSAPRLNYGIDWQVLKSPVTQMLSEESAIHFWYTTRWPPVPSACSSVVSSPVGDPVERRPRLRGVRRPRTLRHRADVGEGGIDAVQTRNRRGGE